MTFIESMDFLIEEIGDGDISAHVVVDQVYAQNQHESWWFKHPDGGQAYYLRDPLFASAPRYMQMAADKLITETGSALSAGMMDIAEDLSGEVYKHAPWEFGDLRASGHPFVESNGIVIHDRAPLVHRLSESELEDKARLSRLFGNRPGR